jgi:23S rRNA (cytosine1962-C5)-methyltransferase
MFFALPTFSISGAFKNHFCTSSVSIFTMQLLTPQHWKTYRLIDSGNFEKLEKFGDFVLSRPEPQAVWDKSMADSEWQKMASALFKKEKNNPEKGQWEAKKGMPERWFIDYKQTQLQLTFKAGFISFKHVGIFPEQAVNWDYIYEKLNLMSHPQPRVLNLFAYTGGASLAAKTGRR